MDLEKSVVCFLPCRKGSERVKRKNVKPFGPFKRGLIEIKLNQLAASQNISKIVLSTNDDEILDFADSLHEPKLIAHRRSEQLSSSATSTDALVAHAREVIGEAHILWTHVTSPFITAEKYDAMIEAYWAAMADGYDSLMTTTAIHGFLWNDANPINYDRNVEKWPRTQTLQPIFEVNSGGFIASSEVYTKLDDRIGQRPLLYTLDKLTAMDIDWDSDFKIAEQMLLAGICPV